jgi:hypothetical protein
LERELIRIRIGEGRSQRLDPARAPGRRRPVGDHLDIGAPRLGTDQRADNPGADCQPVGADADLALTGSVSTGEPKTSA